MRVVLVYIARAIIIVFVIGCLSFIIWLTTDEDTWSTDEDDSDADKLQREKNRGTLVSIAISALMNAVGCFMFYVKVKEGLVVTNYGFILGPVIGFLLDQGVGTDEGFRDFMTVDGFQYTFASLCGGDFIRYIVTMFMDLFISNPLQDIMKIKLRELGVIEVLKEDIEPWSGEPKHRIMVKYDEFIGLNLPSILQSIVAFVTFSAYTNQTRFAWAYAAETLDRDQRMPPGTIMVGSAISGVMYLIFYATMDHFSDRAYYSVNTKIMYVIFILLLMSGLSYTESIEAPVEGEDYTSYSSLVEEYKPVLGFLLFVMFVLYGFVYPIWTRLGCICGYCKPSHTELLDTDHVIYEPEGTALPDDQRRAIQLEVEATLRSLGYSVPTIPRTEQNL